MGTFAIALTFLLPAGAGSNILGGICGLFIGNRLAYYYDVWKYKWYDKGARDFTNLLANPDGKIMKGLEERADSWKNHIDILNTNISVFQSIMSGCPECLSRVEVKEDSSRPQWVLDAMAKHNYYWSDGKWIWSDKWVTSNSEMKH